MPYHFLKENMTYVRFPNSDMIVYVAPPQDHQHANALNKHVENLTFWIPVDDPNAWAELTSVSKTFICGHLASFLHDVRNSFQIPDNVPEHENKFLRFFVNDNTTSVTCYIFVDHEVPFEYEVKSLDESWFWTDLVLLAGVAEEED